MKNETTFLILKPDCVAKGLSGEVLRRLENAGFVLRGIKMAKLPVAVLEEHYSHLKDKAFFPEIIAFMTSGPVVLAAFSGDDVVAKVRDIVGPTDSKKAAKGTIRGDFGVDVMVNVVHASDSVENAKIELKRFFKEEELFEPGTPVKKSNR